MIMVDLWTLYKYLIVFANQVYTIGNNRVFFIETSKRARCVIILTIYHIFDTFSINGEKIIYPSSQEQAGAVRRRIISKTNFNSVFGKFMAVSSTYNPVSFNSRVGNLENTYIYMYAIYMYY